MPSDFAFTEVAYGYHPAPSEVVATLTNLFSQYIFETPPVPDDEDYDGTWYFRHRAVDTSGNRSEWSPQSSIVPKRLVDEASIRFELDEKQREIDAMNVLLASGLDEVNQNLIPLQQLTNQNQSRLDELNTVTLPGVQSSLQAVESDLSTAQGQINTLNNTTLPSLDTRLSDAQNRVRSTFGENLIPDPGFETNYWFTGEGFANQVALTRPQMTRNTVSTPYRGAAFMQVGPDPLPTYRAAWFHPDWIAVEQGQVWEFRAAYRGQAAGEMETRSANHFLFIAQNGSWVTYSSPIHEMYDATDGVWRNGSVRFTIPEGVTTIRPAARFSNTAGWMGIDQVSLVNVTAAATVHHQVNQDMAAVNATLNTLNNTTIPGINSNLSAVQASVNTINNTTIPGVRADLAAAQGQINTLNNTTLPNLNQALTTGLAGANEWREVGAISASNLRIGSWDNLIHDPDFNDLYDGVTWVGGTIFTPESRFGWQRSESAAYGGLLRLNASQVNPNGVTRVLYQGLGGNGIRVEPGEEFSLTATVWRSTSGSATNRLVIRAQVFNAGGDTLGWPEFFDVRQSGTREYTGSITIPAGGKRIRIDILNGTDSAQAATWTGGVWIAAPWLHRRVNSMLLVDGSVLTDKLAANAVSTDKIQANAITTAKIAANAVTANEIAALTITAGNIAANAVTTAKIATNAITANELAANSVQAGHITANAVSAGKIAANAISTRELQANSVGTLELIAGSVTTTILSADAVEARNIAANAVRAGHITANAVTTAKIATNAVTANEIAANTIVAGNIATNAIQTRHLQANSVGADQIIARSIGTAHLQARTIQAHQMQIGSFDNLFNDPQFSSYRDHGTGANSPWITVTGNPSGIWRWMDDSNAGASIVSNTSGTASRMELFCGNVNPGDEMSLRIRVRKNSSADGFRIAARHRGEDRSSPLASTILLGTSFSGLSSDSIWESTWTVPNNTGIRELWIDFETLGTSTGSARFSDPYVRRRVDSLLLVDGSILTRHLTANSVTSDKITANAITAREIAALAISAGHVQANAITADKIHFGSLNGSLITGLQIQTHTNNRGVKITNAGIRAFNSSGSETFTVDANTGDFTATSGTITGVTLQTGTNISATGGVMIRADPSQGNIIGYDTSGNVTIRLGGARNEFSGSITAADITGSTLTGGEVRTSTAVFSSGGAVMRASGAAGNFIAVDNSGTVTARLGGSRNELSFLNVTGVLRMGSSSAEGALVPDRSRLRLQGRMPFDDGVARDMFLYGLSAQFRFSGAEGPVNGWSVTYPEPRPFSNSAPIVTASVTDSRRHLSINTTNETASGFDAVFMPLYAHPDAAQTFRCRYMSVWRG